MIGYDHDTIGLVQSSLVRTELKTVEAHVRHVRIGVSQMRPTSLQELNDIESRRLTNIVDVLLIGYSENVYSRAFHRLATIVERVLHLLDNEHRHLAIDVTGQLDKPSLDSRLPRLPRQVVRIDRYAVAPQPRPWIERHKAKRLCRGGFDYFPDIDI